VPFDIFASKKAQLLKNILKTRFRNCFSVSISDEWQLKYMTKNESTTRKSLYMGALEII